MPGRSRSESMNRLPIFSGFSRDEPRFSLDQSNQPSQRRGNIRIGGDVDRSTAFVAIETLPANSAIDAVTVFVQRFEIDQGRSRDRVCI